MKVLIFRATVRGLLWAVAFIAPPLAFQLGCILARLVHGPTIWLSL